MISVLTESSPNIKTKHTKKIKFIKIVCFKCKQCGETDEEIAEKYCGNVGCKYRSK